MIIVRGWRTDHDALLAEIRSRFEYQAGELRATGWLQDEDEPWLVALKDDLHQLLGVRFEVTAFQAYRNGDACCQWHNDPPFADQAILSLGTARTFCVRRRDGEPQPHRLEAGDLLYMPSGFQDEWEHSVPAEPDVVEERVSLVFRTNKEN